MVSEESVVNTADVEGQTIEDKSGKIRKQIEYYFSDLNLMRDKFLQEELKSDNGWVPFETLLKFNRLAALTKNVDDIIGALNESDLMEVSDDRLKVRRTLTHPIPDLNDDFKRAVIKRTAYVKNFPLDEKLDDILEFFQQFHIENVIMRNYRDKKEKCFKFKGSCFVTFPSVDKCKEFIDQETIGYKSVENLMRKSQDVYMEQKKEEMAAKKMKKNKKTSADNNDKVDKESETPNGTEIENGESDKGKKVEYPKGSLMQFTFDTTDEGAKKLTALDIKKGLLLLKDNVLFVDMGEGDSGVQIVRLRGENSANVFIKEHEEKPVEINGVKLQFSAVPEEDEKSYYLKLQQKSAPNKKVVGGRKRGRQSKHFHAKRAKRE